MAYIGKEGTLLTQTPEVREIWVQRDNDLLEYKLWFIYHIRFATNTEIKVVEFLGDEKKRYFGGERVNEIVESKFMVSAEEYTNISSNNRNLPPRLIDIEETLLDKMPTELTTDKNGFTYGDSVGGISPNKPPVHNEKLMSRFNSIKRVLINPGVLARIEIWQESIKYYVFQLAEKNLRKKGSIFYKPIGGHLKYKDSFVTLIEKFSLELKNGAQVQDDRDLSLYISPKHFMLFAEIIKKDLVVQRKFDLIENPSISIYRELVEEIGPLYASDGISILGEKDLELINDKIGGRKA